MHISISKFIKVDVKMSEKYVWSRKYENKIYIDNNINCVRFRAIYSELFTLHIFERWNSVSNRKKIWTLHSLGLSIFTDLFLLVYG